MAKSITGFRMLDFSSNIAVSKKTREKQADADFF